MRVTIVGTGTVGQAFGVALALNGHEVMFYDIEPKTLPILAKFTVKFREAFDHGECMVICVPTELGPDGTVDLSIFKSVCHQFATYAQGDGNKRILIQKSTCPPRTACRISDWLQTEYGLRNGIEYEYVVHPAFLNMGSPITDELLQRKCLVGLREPDDTGAWIHGKMRKMLHWAEPIFAPYTAVELAKYSNNVMHAGILSIWNELHMLGEILEVDTDWVAKVTTLELGLESTYRVHGMAWGGKCLPKDTMALLEYARASGASMPLLESIITVNDTMARKYGVRTQHWAELQHVDFSNKGSKLACPK